RAHAFLPLGPTPDRDGQIVSATFPGNPGAAVRFVASARAGGDPTATRISGVVLDGSNVPVPNVLVGVGDTSMSAMTDAEGQFTIAPAPVGRVDLWIVGSTTTRAGVWPSLPYELVTVPGEDNSSGRWTRRTAAPSRRRISPASRSRSRPARRPSPTARITASSP